MKKIPTIFLRDFDNDPRYVTEEPNPECAWVFAGEGVPTRKYDGTCVMFDGDRWWARREVKPGKATPPNFAEVERDKTTGKTVGWEPIEQSAFAKYHAEALAADADEIGEGEPWAAGTYELIGPKVNGNPEKAGRHALVEHAWAEPLPAAPRDYAGLAAYLAAFIGEGIVFHHPDGRMAKIKARDFRA